MRPMKIRPLLILLSFPTIVFIALMVLTNSASLGDRPGEPSKQSTNSANNELNISGEEFLKIFLDTVGKNNSTLAINMIDTSIFTDSNMQKDWEKGIDNIQSLNIKNFEKHLQDKWTAEEEAYLITMEIKVKNESAEIQAPYLKWNNGDNVRIITVKKSKDSLWRVTGIFLKP
jgi:hypothetical protein